MNIYTDLRKVKDKDVRDIIKRVRISMKRLSKNAKKKGLNELARSLLEK